jgi:tetraacyldisaccharide 4'-kinase
MLMLLGRPFSPAYGTMMKIRAWAYRNGYFKIKRLPCPVISIGNLCLGGTGKSPHVIAISKWLQEQGLSPAVVSRGYGGRAGQGPMVVSDGNEIKVSTRDAGDEPVMMAQALPGVPVVVGSDRYADGKLAVERLGAQVIVLDDAFQHLAIFRDIDLLLLPSGRFFGTQWVFPGGDLREPVSSISRATAILLTRAELLSRADQEMARHEIQKMVPERPVFLSKMQAVRFISMEGESETPDRLSERPVFAFCALGSPEAFFATIENLGSYIMGRATFPDHYAYRAEDLQGLMRQAREQGATALITTDKDRVKIEPIWHELINIIEELLPIWVLEIEARPEQGLWNILSADLDINSQYKRT